MDRMDNLPAFQYHPYPLRSGSVVESKVKCKCCRKARGYIYAGPVYAEDELGESICPWCIADGAAHEKYDASFIDTQGIPDDVPPQVMEEIAYRTPGYSTWQSERWLTCCGEAAAFVEPVGIQEVHQNYPQLEGDLMGYIVHEMRISGGAARQMLNSLQRDAGPTAYVFKCRKCDGHRAFIDGIFDIEEE